MHFSVLRNYENSAFENKALPHVCKYRDTFDIAISTSPSTIFTVALNLRQASDVVRRSRWYRNRTEW